MGRRAATSQGEGGAGDKSQRERRGKEEEGERRKKRVMGEEGRDGASDVLDR